MKDILIEIEKTEDKDYIIQEESCITGFDQETKKSWKAVTKTFRYAVLIEFGNHDFMIGHRVKTIFSNGTILDWHWKETIPEAPKNINPLKTKQTSWQ